MKRILRIPAALTLVILFAVGLSSCGPESTPATPTGTAAPMNEIDVMINEYEKSATEFIRVTRKHETGDVSITVKLINDEKLVRETAAKLQQESAKMTPAQARRVASINAKTAPLLW